MSVAPVVSERRLQEAVNGALALYHWRAYHTWNSLNSTRGFPDIMAVRAGRLIAAELKREGKNPTPEQEAWISDLRSAGVEVYVWWPSDWFGGVIDGVLRPEKA